jgi:hypothetical protein
MASAALTMPGPRAATKASASKSFGTARNTSVTRMNTTIDPAAVGARYGADGEPDRRRR